MFFGLSVALIDCPDTRTCRPVSLPSASRRLFGRPRPLRPLVDGVERSPFSTRAVGRCRGEALFEPLGDARARDVAVAGLVPDDGQPTERFLPLPPGVGHHRNAGVLNL